MIKHKQLLILKRIDQFLSRNLSIVEDHHEQCADYFYIQQAFEKEKCLESYDIQQMFESSNTREKLQEGKDAILRNISIKLTNDLSTGTSFQKIAKLQELFISFEFLDSTETFEQILFDVLLKEIVVHILNITNLSDIISTIDRIIHDELSWFLDSIRYASTKTLLDTYCSVMASILIKGILNKTEYFPINSLETFSENYQSYYSFVDKIFSGKEIPSKLRIHLRKKQNLLYKAYMVNAIKKLEGGLISLSNFIESSKSKESIEEYCTKKFKKQFTKAMQDFILRNVSKDTVTSSLLDRVFSLGIRTIIRILDFFENLYGKIKDIEIIEYLAFSSVTIAVEIKQQIHDNIEEIKKKVSIKSELFPGIRTLFDDRIRDLMYAGISRLFISRTEKTLKLEDDIAGIALKLSMQPHEPEEPSHVINSAKIAFSKFERLQLLKELVSSEDVHRAISNHLISTFKFYYNKQINDASNTIEINKKFTSDMGKLDFSLDKFLEKQREIDIQSIGSLI